MTPNSRSVLLVFMAAGANHFLWYGAARAAVQQNLLVTLIYDAAYAVLSLLVLKEMIEVRGWQAWAGLLAGGALGTWAALRLTF